MAGCVTTVERPSAPTSKRDDGALTYGQASTYVEGARQNIEKRLGEVDELEAATKLGVGVGIAGAATAAAFDARDNPILGLLTLGALSYTANQAVAPKTLAPLYNAGLENLDCIDGAGAEANGKFVGQSAMLAVKSAQIESLVASLRRDIDEAASNTSLAAVAEEARVAADAGETIRQQIQQYQSYNPVAGAMILSTNRTVRALNQQLRERSPSIEAIAQSGSIFSTFLSSGAGIRKDVAAAAAQVKSAGAAASGNALNDRLTANTARLKALLDSVPPLLTPISVTPIGACQAQFAAEAPLVLQTPSPIEVTAGGAPQRLEVAGEKPFYLLWSKPSDIQLSPDLHGIAVSATETAKDGEYRFRVKDYTGKVSTDEYVLKIHAKAEGDEAPPAQDAPPTSSTANKKPGPPPSPTGA